MYRVLLYLCLEMDVSPSHSNAQQALCGATILQPASAEFCHLPHVQEAGSEAVAATS